MTKKGIYMKKITRVLALVLIFSFPYGCEKKGLEKQGSNSILTSIDYDVTLLESFGELYAKLSCEGDPEVDEAIVDTSSSTSLDIVFKPKSKLDGLECSCKIYTKDLSDLAALKEKYNFAFSTDEQIVLLASDIEAVSNNSLSGLVFYETFSEKTTSSEDSMKMSLSLKVEEDISFESFTLLCDDKTQVITKSLDFVANDAANLIADVNKDTAVDGECKINGLKGNEIYSNDSVKFQKTDDGQIEGMDTYLLKLQAGEGGRTQSNDVVVSGNVDKDCEEIEVSEKGAVSCKKGANDTLPENLQELMTRLETIDKDYLSGIDLENTISKGKKINVRLSNGRISVEKHKDSSEVSYKFLTKNHKIEDVEKTERTSYDQFSFDLNGWTVKIGTSKFDGSSAEKKLLFIAFRKSVIEDFSFEPFKSEGDPSPAVQPEENAGNDALSKFKKELRDNFGMKDNKVTLQEENGRGQIQLVFDGTKLSVKKVSGEDFAFLQEDLDASAFEEVMVGGDNKLMLRGIGGGYDLACSQGTVRFNKFLETNRFKALDQ